MMNKKFNRKEAISLLDVNKYKRKFENQFESINSGWVIFWKGKPVKPEGGKNHYFASYDSAIEGIHRNMNIFHSILRKELAPKIYGIEYESEEWDIYFRNDLWYDKNYYEGKHVSSSSRKAPLTEEEEELRYSLYEEKRKFESFCDNALKSIFIKSWIAEGILEIKNI